LPRFARIFPKAKLLEEQRTIEKRLRKMRLNGDRAICRRKRLGETYRPFGSHCGFEFRSRKIIPRSGGIKTCRRRSKVLDRRVWMVVEQFCNSYGLPHGRR
jgi:hypothetical protein